MSQKRIISGVAFSWLRFLVGFIVTLIQTSLYFKYLPKEVIGVWFLFFSAAAFIQMSDFGLPSAVSRTIAYVKNKNVSSEQEEVKFYAEFSIKDIYHSAFKSFLITAAIVVILGSLIIFLVRPTFGLAQAYSTEVSTAFIIFIFGVFLNMTASIPNACLSGLGDVGYDNLLRIIVQVIGFIAIWILLPTYSSIKTLSVVYLFQGAFSTILAHWFLRFRHKELFNLKSKYNALIVKRLYKESIPLFINTVGSWLTNQSGIWIATAVLGVSLIADYNVLIQLIFYGLSISMSIPSAINPFASAAFSTGGVRGIHKHFFVTLKSSTFIVGFWIVVLAIWGNSILDLWIGSGHFLGYAVLIPLLINLFLEMQHSINGGFVWNTGKWPFVPVTLAAGLLNVLFGVIGCHYWGFTGLAFGTMLAKLLTMNWYVVYYALKRIGISIRFYCTEFLARVILLIGFSLPVAYITGLLLFRISAKFVVRDLPGNVFLSCLIGGCITLAFWSTGYYILVLNGGDRIQLKNIIIKIRHAGKL